MSAEAIIAMEAIAFNAPCFCSIQISFLTILLRYFCLFEDDEDDSVSFIAIAGRVFPIVLSVRVVNRRCILNRFDFVTVLFVQKVGLAVLKMENTLGSVAIVIKCAFPIDAAGGDLVIVVLHGVARSVPSFFSGGLVKTFISLIVEIDIVQRVGSAVERFHAERLGRCLRCVSVGVFRLVFLNPARSKN